MDKRHYPQIAGGCLLLFSVSAQAGGGHGSSGGLLDLDPGLAIWTIITFVTLLFILKTFAWKPLLQSLESREHHIRETLENSEWSQHEAQQILERAQMQLADVNDQARQVLEDAEDKAKKVQDEAIGATETHCLRLKNKTKEEIKQLQAKAVADVWGQLGDFGIQIAGQLLKKSINPDDHAAIIDEALADIRKRMET